MDFQRKTFDTQHYIYVEKTCQYADIAENIGAAFGAIFGFVGDNGIEPISAPMTLYTAMPSGPEMTFRGGVIVSAKDAAKASGEILTDTIDAGDAMHTMHLGPYAGIGQTHQQLWAHMEENEITATMPVWEIYVDDPGEVAEAALRTELYRAIA